MLPEPKLLRPISGNVTRQSCFFFLNLGVSKSLKLVTASMAHGLYSLSSVFEIRHALWRMTNRCFSQIECHVKMYMHASTHASAKPGKIEKQGRMDHLAQKNFLTDRSTNGSPYHHRGCDGSPCRPSAAP